MLEAIRKRSSSIVVKALLGLLILSFAAWGIGDMIRTGAAVSSVADVGEVEIAPEALDAEVQREMDNLRRALGTSFNQDVIQLAGLAGVVIHRIVDRTLFSLGAESLGVTVGDDLVSAEIRRTPTFANELGHFDRLRFQEVIRSQGWSEPRFIELMRRDMARAQYLDSVNTGGPAPAALAEVLYKHRRQGRIASVVTVTDASMPAPAAPDEGTLAKFHQDNAARYTAPEYRAVTAVRLDAADLAGEMSVTEDEVRESFEARADEFQTPERRRIQQMLLASEGEAKAAHERLMKGEDFKAVAKDAAGMDDSLINLGTVTRDGLPIPEMADAAFALVNGTFSAPTKSPLGWHILRVDLIEPGSQQSFEDVREPVANDLKREKAVDGLYELANRLEDSLGGGATLEEASNTLNLKLVTVAAIDATGKGKDGQPVSGLPGGPFLNTVFSTESGEASILTETGADGYFILRVDEVIPPALRPLEEVRAAASADWTAEKRAEAAKAAADAIAEKVRGGTALAEAADGLSVSEAGPMTRDGGGAPAGMAPTQVAALFDQVVGGVAVGRGGDGYIVARLERIEEADPASDKTTLDSMKAQISGAMRGDLLAQLAAGLRVRHPVAIHTGAIQQMYTTQQ